MQAIITKYHGPSNTRGARIRATWGADSVTISYPHELSGIDCHAVAAEALRQKLAKRNKEFASTSECMAPLLGAFVSGGVYCFIPNPAKQHLARVLYSRCALGESGNPYCYDSIKAALAHFDPAGGWASDAYKQFI